MSGPSRKHSAALIVVLVGLGMFSAQTNSAGATHQRAMLRPVQLTGSGSLHVVARVNYSRASSTIDIEQVTPTPTSTGASSAGQPAKIQTNANLRAGPGTNYPRIGRAPAGQMVEIVARNPAGDWFQLTNGAWVFGNLLENPPNVPIAQNIVTPPADSRTSPPTVLTPKPPSSEKNGDQSPIIAKVRTNANLRTGPGTSYPILKVAKAGQTLVIVGRNSAGDWYQTDAGAWVFGELLDKTAIELDVPTNGAPASNAPTRYVATPKPITHSNTPASDNVNRYGMLAAILNSMAPWVVLPLPGMILWIVALVLIVMRRRWRWTIQCLFLTILLPPVGWFVTLWASLLLVKNPIQPTSPRELVQRIAESKPMMVILVVLGIILTAVSWLGAAIFLAMLVISYFIFLKLLPGPGRDLPTYGSSVTPGSTTPVSAYLPSSSSYIGPSDISYDSSMYPSDDLLGNNRQDKGGEDEGNIWDGWLFKY